MNISELFSNGMPEGGGVVSGGVIGSLLVGVIVLAILVGIVIYVYHALAWMKIAKKQKHKYPWLAWIPLANIAMILEMGSFHWALIFLLLIPILGWIAVFVLLIISLWRIYEKAKYPGWLSLAQIIPQIGSVLYLIIIGLVAWRKPGKK